MASGVDKAAARKAAFAARKLAFAAGQGQAAEILADVLAEYRGCALAGYMAMRTEADPMAAMLAHQGPVCVPVIIAQGEALRFRELSPGCAMEMGAFGAMIPAEGAWIEPEVLIVPLVGFDARGYRLGYGGGFYDRTLERLRRDGGALAIGLAYAVQEIRAIPAEPTDQVLDLVVTDRGVVRPQGEK